MIKDSSVCFYGLWRLSPHFWGFKRKLLIPREFFEVVRIMGDNFYFYRLFPVILIYNQFFMFLFVLLIGCGTMTC
jgi:hypothetical protein